MNRPRGSSRKPRKSDLSDGGRGPEASAAAVLTGVVVSDGGF